MGRVLACREWALSLGGSLGSMVSSWPVPAEAAGGWLGSAARALKGQRAWAGEGE